MDDDEIEQIEPLDPAVDPPGPFPGPPPPPPTPPAARWARSDDRVIGGVAGGLAHGVGLDPLILRLGFVAIGVLSPAGLPAYFGAWLLLRNDPYAPPVNAARKVFGAVLSGLAVIGILSSDGPSFGGNVLLAAVLIGVAFAIWGPRRSEEGRDPSAWRTVAEEAQEGLRTAVDGVRDATGNLTFVGKRSNVEAEWAPRRRTLPPRQPASPLGRLGFAAAILAGIVTFVAAGRDAESATWGFGTAAIVCGAALLIGVFWGRARWLIIPGLLAAACALVTDSIAWAKAPFNTSSIDGYERPTSPAEVRPTYRYGTVDLDLDLTNITEDVSTTVQAGVGEIVVLVPDSARVTVRATIGFGEVDIPGDRSSEFVSRDVVQSTFGPEGGVRIDLDLTVGVGGIDVYVSSPNAPLTVEPIDPGSDPLPPGAYARDEIGIYYPGAVVRPDGTVLLDDGTMIYPDGSIESSSSIRRGADGVLTFAGGAQLHPDGELRLADGTSLWRSDQTLFPVVPPTAISPLVQTTIPLEPPGPTTTRPSVSTTRPPATTQPTATTTEITT